MLVNVTGEIGEFLLTLFSYLEHVPTRRQSFFFSTMELHHTSLFACVTTWTWPLVEDALDEKVPLSGHPEHQIYPLNYLVTSRICCLPESSTHEFERYDNNLMSIDSIVLNERQHWNPRKSKRQYYKENRCMCQLSIRMVPDVCDILNIYMYMH